MNFYQVAVNFPKSDCVFTYKAQDTYETGDLVEVPFGKRKAKGTLLRTSTQSEISQLDQSLIKPIYAKIENAMSLSQKELELYTWMSKYYHYSLGKLIFDCLPKILKRPRKIDFIQGEGKASEFELNQRQSEIVENILKNKDLGFSQHYIHGVTGSGKSAIYLSAMKSVLKTGKSVQFLLPEINLTPQFTQIFSTYLDCPVYTYHSGVTPSEKYTIWKLLNESEKPVLVMGVRSSLFLPVKNLGLIIVDEEHDQSFKQTDRCPYNGRDVAIKKSQINTCPVILGSATPTVENYFQFQKESHNRFYYPIKKRVAQGHFPQLKLLDIKDKFKENNPAWPFLDETLAEIEKHLFKQEQVLIFINKLGYSSYVQCRNCGHQFYNDVCGCQNNLRYFKHRNCLSCSHCDFVMPMPDQCPECGGISLLNKGFGTEKVEQVLSELFPQYCTERFDRDEIKTTKDLNDKLKRFHNKDIDILVGTQMLAKGHNFKRVNLVVILGIDSMLSYADFRSSEKTFQLVEQISGRAGRFSDSSQVIIQTLTPEHHIFELIQSHSFDGFYKEELPLRELCACPPFAKMAMLFFSSHQRDKLILNISEVAKKLQKTIDGHFPQVRLLGPTPLGVEKKANQFTWAIMLKSSQLNQLHALISTFESNYQQISGLTCKIDIDPMQIL
jgi:primosomal protein N' (replication factor Y)